jgi:hypothetical protein
MNGSYYLDAPTDTKFKAKCEQLGITPGEAIQKNIQLLINTPLNLQCKDCLNCQYYQMGQTEVFETLRRLNKVSDLFLGNLLKKKKE